MAKHTKKLYIVFIIISAAVMLIFSDRAAFLAGEALNTCAALVIPSLFPYMIISSMIVSSGASDFLGIIARPVTRFIGVPDRGGTAFLMGALCGFPVGAICASKLYKSGQISKCECEKIIAVSNNTGPAFVMGVVGAGFWNSRSFGIVLYAAQIICAVISGVIMFRIRKEKEKDVIYYSDKKSKSTVRTSISESFTEAVTSSASGILAVCGYIVFFAVITGLVKDGFSYLKLPDGLQLGIASMLEFTAGSKYAAITGGKLGLAAAGFTIGWSGISVFFQSSSFTSPLGISLLPTIRCKLLQGGLCALVCFFVGERFVQFTDDIPTVSIPSVSNSGVVIAVFLFLMLITAAGAIKKYAAEKS